MPEQHFTQPPPRYTEATLVKALEEQGIGRPSTYAPTIATLAGRDYVDGRGEAAACRPSWAWSSTTCWSSTSRRSRHRLHLADGGGAGRDRGGRARLGADDAASSTARSPRRCRAGRADDGAGQGRSDEPTDEVCEKCGRPMVIKLGRYGKFLACTGFPGMPQRAAVAAQDRRDLPAMRQGEIVERRSQEGPHLLRLQRYPACDFVSWNNPVRRACPNCGALHGRGGPARTAALSRLAARRRPSLAKAG